ncbi:decarboxylating NADP(+)-dependent phosphogluconate dehydrogenase [Algibacillus agarilyticus]|uniref:decarboxylating NADP(+)-dependent phosphogluconate dehydrogenase n=1 Tax=Algibacillus agarilyticus TaxID=2234133 RepID=UPI000DD03C34|nr:decarboxylating NADP(+)-dependent phosphogluconate dehydrogenase [Algibacillus agarilyticus]
MKDKSDIGLVGLAVMGENLILNMASKGFTVTAYNRSYDKVERFLKGRAEGQSIRGADSIEALVDSLASPRQIMLMVKAGQPVDDFIELLVPHLDAGDIIIDGGNTHYPDSNRRTEQLHAKGIYYIGAGVSGGEEGALKGPSIMPGGAVEAWPAVKAIFQGISAKVADDKGQLTVPCCDWVGDAGAGHFVKMVHNGIEYGDMQLICEAYQLMKEVLGLSADELHDVFATWNETELDSYLIEITRDIFAYKDQDGSALVENILDTAGQKGTGKWTGVTALDLGVPLTLIGEAVFARCISAQKAERVEAAKVLKGPAIHFTGDKKAFIDDIRKALLASKIVSYAQGYVLFQQAAKEFDWNLNYGAIALMWRGGCIIRSAFLGKIKEAFDDNPELPNLLLNPYFKDTVLDAQQSWRNVVGTAVANGVPVPCLSAALTYFDGYRTERLPANLLQAQRDFFGAHTYERTDKPRGEFFHTNWTGRGGDTASTTYNV